MASNFNIHVHQNSDNLHLRLTGDFDGASAQHLLSELRRNTLRATRVFIHTNCLGRIHPLGREVLHGNLDRFRNQDLSFVFTGENACEMAP